MAIRQFSPGYHGAGNGCGIDYGPGREAHQLLVFPDIGVLGTSNTCRVVHTMSVGYKTRLVGEAHYVAVEGSNGNVVLDGGMAVEDHCGLW